MAFEILKNFNTRLDLKDRRLILGIFVPSFIQGIILFVIWNKELPSEIIDFFYLSLTAIFLSVLFHEFSPWLNWHLSTLFSKNYNNYLVKNFDRIFVEGLQDQLKQGNIDINKYKIKMFEFIPTIVKRAKSDYKDHLSIHLEDC